MPLDSQTDTESERSEASDPPLHCLAAGDLVEGRFEVECVAAATSLSVVYRAFDRTSGEQVAVKVLRERDSATHQRFAAEVDALAAISHPAVVRYVAHGSLPGHADFLAMEWLSGEDLGQRLSRVGLRASECLALMRQLCTALSVAHAHGVLHRDIKPSNIFLVGGSIEQVKLLDFGVARPRTTTRIVTQAGSFVGTIGYMSPEQVRGDSHLDSRSDLFSVGALLFECLAGRPAFAGAHDLAVLAKVLHDELPSLAALRPDLGAEFDALMARLLAKDRVQRPATARAALGLIERTYEAGRFDDSIVAPASRTSTSFGEQRIASVIAVRPRKPLAAASDAEQATLKLLADAAREYEVDICTVPGRAWLLVPRTGAHRAATDQALHAARCALRLSAHAELRIAVATGTVDASARIPLGVAVDRALALMGGDGALVALDDLTARLLGNRFHTRTEQLPQVALVLERENDSPDANDVVMGKSTPFVGRLTELAILQATLKECVADDVSRAVLVVGPPGAGKSRLARELIERVRATKQARVIIGRCDPTTAFSPLGLVQRLLRSAAQIPADAPNEVQHAALTDYLRVLDDAVDDDMLDFLGEAIGAAPRIAERALHRAARSDAEVMREQKRRAIERWFGSLAAQGPSLVLLEDLHWADLLSITYIQNALQSLTGHAMFVLATSRPDPETHLCFLRERGVFQEVVLRGLTRKAAERLARAMMPEGAPDVVERVVALASGNAFYLEELVRRVAEDGTTELPETIVAMAQSRIERLAPDARQLLCKASVFGETISERVLGRGSDLDASTEATLASLVEAEILRPSPPTRLSAPREFTFRHALLREAAYAMLTDAERRREHLRAAELLEKCGERDARVLADHFERGGSVARAVPWIAKAAMAALDSGDYENAITLARRGTSLGAYGDQRGQLLLVGAYASTWKCDPELPDEALSLLPRATAPWWLALSVSVYNTALMGTPERADSYLRLALTTSPDTVPSGAYGQALQVLAAGAALVGRASVGWALVEQFESSSSAQRTPEDAVFRAWFNLSKCILASNSTLDGQWQLGAALRWGEASLAAMRSLGATSGEAACLFHLGNAYWLAGNFDRAMSLLKLAWSLAKQTGNRLVEEHSAFLLAVASIKRGAQSEALKTLTSLAASPNQQISHAAATVLAESLCRTGDFEGAIARARHAANGCSLMYRRVARATLARAYLGLGEFAASLEATEEAFSEGESSAFPHLAVDLLGARAQALLACGSIAEAERTVREACDFRDAVARGIDDEVSRSAFRSRGRANRSLDELAVRLAVSSRD